MKLWTQAYRVWSYLSWLSYLYYQHLLILLILQCKNVPTNKSIASSAISQMFRKCQPIQIVETMSRLTVFRSKSIGVIIQLCSWHFSCLSQSNSWHRSQVSWIRSVIWQSFGHFLTSHTWKHWQTCKHTSVVTEVLTFGHS